MSVTVNLNNTERVMYRGNNHIKCIYGPNNTLLWSEEPYFTLEATGTGNIQLRIDNSGSATQITPAVIYYWKNVEPNAARDNYTGYITAMSGQQSGNTVSYVAGDKIKFWRAEQTALANGLNNSNYFTALSNSKVYGNIASLVNYVDILPEFCFTRMFYYCNFTDCTGLILPWNIITNNAFKWMFYGCAKFTELPLLPATTVGAESYHQMFRQCNGLVNVNLAEKMCCRTAGLQSFQNMFFSSIGLTTIVIPSNINYTGNKAWNRAFYGCSNLSNITCLDDNPTGNNRYSEWLMQVSSTGTFTKAAGANWPSGASGIPTGWTVVEQ